VTGTNNATAIEKVRRAIEILLGPLGPYIPLKIRVEKWRETEYCAPTPNGEATYQSTIIAKLN
jgi:hypothetical protein